MKFSIIIESPYDLERLKPLLTKINLKQKEGKYLFYRMVLICNPHEEKDLKKCIKLHKIKVPFSYWEKDEHGDIPQKESLPHFFEEELFRNPVEMFLILDRTPITQQCNIIAQKYKIKVAYLADQNEKDNFHFATDHSYPFRDETDCDQIIQEIITLYQL